MSWEMFDQAHLNKIFHLQWWWETELSCTFEKQKEKKQLNHYIFYITDKSLNTLVFHEEISV